MSKFIIITERIGMYSPTGTLEDAIAQWAHKEEIVALCEPTDVIVRRYWDGIPSLHHAKQVEIKSRLSKRSRWSYGILTFDMDKYGETEA